MRPHRLRAWLGALIDRPAPLDLLTGLLRLQGGFAFSGGWNPLVAGLQQGPDALARFYSAFQPRNVAEFYRLDRTGERGEDLPPWAVPWLAWKNHKPPSAEGGLDPDAHGVSYYGPCTPEKIALEHRRLTTLAASIREKGYRPEKHGHIQGCMMLRGSEMRFFVKGGKHRAAVLASLNWPTVPVTFKPAWPGTVVRNMAADWPLVRDGLMSERLAERVFDRYFDCDGSQQAGSMGLL